VSRPHHPRWKTLTWRKLVVEYARHRRLPFVSDFGPVVPIPGKGLPRKFLNRRRAQGRQAVSLLKDTLACLDRAGIRPSRPARLTRVAMNRIRRAVERRRGKRVTAQGLQTFWEAIILTRAGYRCEYCGRSAPAIYRERGRRTAVRMLVDHQQPPVRGGASYTFSNRVPACWSCNLLKPSLPRDVFEPELRSLAEAVVRANTGVRGK